MAVNANKKSEKKRFVIYTRCSTDEQAQGDFTTLDAQAYHCKNMLDAFGYELADIGKDGIINDDGYSGKDLNRPGIQSILENINKDRSFDGIIFFRLDRLTRNPRDLYSMIDMFRDNEVEFISVRENLDSSTAIGRVVIGILGLLSAFERELTGERVKASALARVRQGKRVGCRTPIGYKLIPDGERLDNGKQPHKIVPNEKVAPHLKIIWEMTAAHKSLPEIGKELEKRGIFSPTGKQWRRQGLAHVIRNPFYKGYVQYAGEIHKGSQEPLVDETLWNKANQIITSRIPGHRFTTKPRQYEFLLSGIVTCGKCGSHLICCHAGGRNNKKFFYYECTRSRQKMGCDQTRISATAFDSAVIEYFRKASEDQEIITKAIGNAIMESQVKLEQIDKKLADKEDEFNTIKHESEKLLELAMNGTVDNGGSTFKSKMSALEAKMTRIQGELSKLQAQKRVAQMNAHSGEFLHHNIRFCLEHLDKIPEDAQRNLLKALIKNIEVFEDKIALNMYISEPIEGLLPNTEFLENALKAQNPTENGEVMASNPLISPGGQKWGG